MRVGVLPRGVSAAVLTGSITRMAWAVGALNLVLDAPILIDVYCRAGMGHYLGLPLSLLAVQLTALAFAAWRATPWALVAYLLVGLATTAGFQLEVFNSIPGADQHYTFLLNRPSVALVLVGVTTTRALIGVAWMFLGFVVATLEMLVVSAWASKPYHPGAGPLLVFVIGVIGYALLAAIQRSRRRRTPNFEKLEAETRDLVRGSSLARRTTAVVHDTVLNDLAIIMNGPDRLGDALRNRLRSDLDTLTSAEWLTTANDVVRPDEQQVRIRNQLIRIASEMQWRGLSLRFSGTASETFRMDDQLADALMDAIRAALENVLQHSGATSAELAFAYTEDLVSVMVVDHGAGFDQAAVPSDRLGIRGSIIARVEDAGGRVAIYSTPGAGTSVILTGPGATMPRGAER